MQTNIASELPGQCSWHFFPGLYNLWLFNLFSVPGPWKRNYGSSSLRLEIRNAKSNQVKELLKDYSLEIKFSMWEWIVRAHLTGFFMSESFTSLLINSCNLRLHMKKILMIKERTFQFHEKDVEFSCWLFVVQRKKI